MSSVLNSMIRFFILYSYATTVIVIATCDLKSTYTLRVKGEAHGGYYISLGLGTPVQNVKLLIDSGSSNFAIAVRQNNHTNNSFDYEASDTFQKTDKSITIRYTEGSWSGFLAEDKLHLCPTVSLCTFPAQFSCITSSENVFEDSTIWNGILGLAYASIAKPYKRIEPFFETLVACGVHNLFALSLCGPFLHSEYAVTTGGQLHLGYTNADFYDGDIMYTPIVKEWYYEVLLTGLKVGGNELTVPCSELNNDKTIIDSGTTYLTFPQAIYNWVLNQLKSQTQSLSVHLPGEFWTEQAVQCFRDSKIIEEFPVIVLSFYRSNNSSFSLVVSPDLYIQKVFKPSEFGLCVKLAICPTKKGTVIGAAVLRGFYVVFDRAKKQIGFANSTCKDMVNISSAVSPMVISSHTEGKEFSDCKFLNPYSPKQIFYLVVPSVLVAFLLLYTIMSLYYFLKSRRKST